jgi:hypothetical protein
MKKILVLFIVLFTVIPAFAQDDDRDDDWKNGKRAAITINPTTIILGTMNEGIGFSIGLEYAFISTFSTKLDLYVVAFRPDGIYNNAVYEDDTLAVSFRGALEARWYPLGSAVDGFFTGVGFQYQQTLGNFTLEEFVYNNRTGQDEFRETKFKGDIALGMCLGAGYKFILGRGRVAFVIEPALDVIWSFHLGKKPEYSGNWMLGQNGFRISTNFGVAF